MTVWLNPLPGSVTPDFTLIFGSLTDWLRSYQVGAIVPVKSTISAADISTASTSAVEMSSSLRVTATVGPSGNAEVWQSAILSVPSGSVACDAILSVATSPTGPWTTVAGFPFNPTDGPVQVVGAVVVTGLTPGTNTFYMGWGVSVGTVTVSCTAGTRTASRVGTFQMVRPL